MPESLTITLSESVMGRLRDHAAERNESISDLAAEATRKIGLQAGITWTRDELYER